MTEVDIVGDKLIINVEGMHKLWALKSHLEIPLAAVEGAEIDPETAHRSAGIKVAGARLPGVITAGTFFQEDGRLFWDVRHPDKAIVIDLANEHFTKLVIDVADPEATVAKIQTTLNEMKNKA